MKISLLTLGTRGDVQPYAVLGRALKQQGHEVTLSTGRNFEAMAREYGIDFCPVQADFQQLINSQEGKEMMKNPFLARKHFKTLVQPMMVGALHEFYALAAKSDGVLYHVKSLGDFFADKFPEKMMRANVVPAIAPTSEFPNPVFSGLSLPSFLNRLTYKLSDLGLSMMKNAVEEFRSGVGLSGPHQSKIPLPSIYGISSHFLPKPKDYPAHSYYTGFWYDQSPQTLTDDIISFIGSDKPTIVVTFGSMTFETELNLPDALRKLSEALSIRIVVVRGWGFQQQSGKHSEHVMLIDSAPYEQLFPRVKAIIHHGGIGTIAECLRAGVPFMSCPVIYPMGDQHFWGLRAYRYGCSVPVVPLKKLTYAILENNVRVLLSSAELAKKSREIAAVLKTEDGPSTAVSVVEQYFKV